MHCGRHFFFQDTFIAGIDTSSVTITWAMSELIRSPRVLIKAQAEVRAVVGADERVRPEDVSILSYLRMVVKETLRLHPPATLLVPREAIRDIQIGGYDVPAKTRIYVNAWAIGRDPASWPDDPEEFNPDRFEVSEIDVRGEHPQLLPFGTGRRICPGISMGMATVEFTLANLLCYIQWALPDGTLSMEEQGKINFQRKRHRFYSCPPHTLAPKARNTHPFIGDSCKKLSQMRQNGLLHSSFFSTFALKCLQSYV
jgi:4-hydroxyphenylacetaldehyde oxime monooxygenase